MVLCLRPRPRRASSLPDFLTKVSHNSLHPKSEHFASIHAPHDVTRPDLRRVVLSRRPLNRASRASQTPNHVAQPAPAGPPRLSTPMTCNQLPFQLLPETRRHPQAQLSVGDSLPQLIPEAGVQPIDHTLRAHAGSCTIQCLLTTLSPSSIAINKPTQRPPKDTLDAKRS